MRYEGDLRERFTVDGIEFVIDMTAGKNRRPSERNSFTLVKTPGVVNSYLAMAQRMEAKSILELGVFQGGSLVLIDRLFQPDTLVGVEIDPSFDAITHYCENQSRNVKVHFETSQADEVAIGEILATDFPDGIDLIVDDASHTFDFTRQSLELTWPHLKVGGTYIIEDWPWSHNLPMQDASHPWHSRPALTNLIFELIVDLGSYDHIRSVSIDRAKAVLVKGSDSDRFLDKGRLRGREFNLI